MLTDHPPRPGRLPSKHPSFVELLSHFSVVSLTSGTRRGTHGGKKQEEEKTVCVLKTRSPPPVA
jgi:hypothetical protein